MPFSARKLFCFFFVQQALPLQGTKENLPHHFSIFIHVKISSDAQTKRQELGIPLSELLEHYPVGEALAADPDPLQDPVTAKLVQHEVRIQFSSLVKQTTVFQVSHGSPAEGTQNAPALCLCLTRTRFSWFGMMQRTKLGLVFRRVAMSLVRDSL